MLTSLSPFTRGTQRGLTPQKTVKTTQPQFSGFRTIVEGDERNGYGAVKDLNSMKSIEGPGLIALKKKYLKGGNITEPYAIVFDASNQIDFKMLELNYLGVIHYGRGMYGFSPQHFDVDKEALVLVLLPKTKKEYDGVSSAYEVIERWHLPYDTETKTLILPFYGPKKDDHEPEGTSWHLFYVPKEAVENPPMIKVIER